MSARGSFEGWQLEDLQKNSKIQGALPEVRKYPKVIIDKKEDKKKE